MQIFKFSQVEGHILCNNQSRTNLQLMASEIINDFHYININMKHFC